jgi:hypothetical protein
MRLAFGADSEEKREPASDINTRVVESLKVLDPNRPIREADISRTSRHVRYVPQPDSCTAANSIVIRSPRRRARASLAEFQGRGPWRS